MTSIHIRAAKIIAEGRRDDGDECQCDACTMAAYVARVAPLIEEIRVHMEKAYEADYAFSPSGRGYRALAEAGLRVLLAATSETATAEPQS